MNFTFLIKTEGDSVRSIEVVLCETVRLWKYQVFHQINSKMYDQMEKKSDCTRNNVNSEPM